MSEMDIDVHNPNIRLVLPPTIEAYAAQTRSQELAVDAATANGGLGRCVYSTHVSHIKVSLHCTVDNSKESHFPYRSLNLSKEDYMAPNTLSLTSLNHISKVCRDVERSVAFYRDVLGFFLVKRPDSFDFDGAWLYNYGIGIHLISGDPPHRSRQINPQADHVSFQADDLDSVVCRLEELRIPYVQQTVQEAGKSVQQIFVHDPDDNMIEICNCGCLPVIYINVTDAPAQVADTSLKISSHPHPHPPVAGAWGSAATTP